MGIMDRFKRAQPEPTIRSEPVTVPINESMIAWLKDEGVTPAGYKKLTDCPEIVSGVNVYADLISSMTIHLMANKKLGDERIINGLSRLVDIAPNPYMNKSTFYQSIVRTMLLGNGNQITVPVFDKDGLLDRLVPIPSSRVDLKADGEGYYVLLDNQTVKMPDEVLHFRINPDLDEPWRGTGFTVLLRDVLKGLKQAKTTKNSMMEQPVPSIIISVDSNAEELASEDGRTELSKRFIDTREQGRPWLIPADMMSVTQVRPLSLRDLAIKEGLDLDRTEVATMLGLPPFLLGVGSFSKEEFNNFVRTRLRPIAKVIEEELTRKLLLKPDWYFRMNSRSLMAYDISELVTLGEAMVDRTAMTRNEWRDLIGMSPRENMEDLIILENYLPIDQIGQQKKLVGNDKEESDEDT